MSLGTLRPTAQASTRSIRRFGCLSIPALLVAALVGHWFYWYAPRSHPGSPVSGDLTAQILMAADNLPVRLWIAFPHQNLPVFERTLDDLEGFSEVASYFVGPHLGSLPRFGPLRLPPSREMVVAGSMDGRRLVVAATVYPLVARLARLAGRLAGNPWLAGGSVQLRDRKVEVQWRDGVWLAVQGEMAIATGLLVPEMEPALVFARLVEPVGPVPEGLYRLDLQPDGWRIGTAETETRQLVELESPAVLPRELALVAASSSSLPPEESVSRIFVMTSGAERASDQLAHAVVVHGGGGERWRLPAESLLSGLGVEVGEESRGSWTLAAYDRAALLEVADQLAYISKLVESADGRPLELGVWIDLAEAGRALDELVRGLDALPLPATEHVRNWTIAARALACLGGSGSLQLRIDGAPPRLDLRVWEQGSD